MNTPTLIKTDPWLAPFNSEITSRISHYQAKRNKIIQHSGSVTDFANAHHYYGLHKLNSEWIFRELAPNAQSIFLIGEFTNWEQDANFELKNIGNGNWEISLPLDVIKHEDKYKLLIKWNGGEGYRIPAYANRVIQDEKTLGYDAQVWEPEKNFKWSDQNFVPANDMPLIYEAHVGMASEEGKVASYTEFENNILPRIKNLGYNTIQFMAIQEHPYYGSFGYHVSNFFASSSRFGTPEELKSLINKAHELGITVIMDIVHSHAVKNELEGIGAFDGTDHLYFHGGAKGNHPAWDSRLFNYGKDNVLQFLLSNCKYWLEEFHFDGYRFDGVTSMLYHNHGLEVNFTEYSNYFNGATDFDSISYLTLANEVIHEVKPTAITIAEEMSGYPGLAGKIKEGGVGFDYRLSMGIPDFWIKLIKEKQDEDWSVDHLFHELNQHRAEEKIIAYAESHDQALVGDKTIIFRLADKEMYDSMAIHTPSLVIDRAIAMHKMIRLITASTSNGGYLNFMGNEFGHPEWIDFPREGNNFSFHYARRQWGLADHPDLRYKYLERFDKAMIELINDKHLLTHPCYKHFGNDHDQVLAFSRGDYLFVFNFNPDRSFSDYGIPTSIGKYTPVLSTDQSDFGGFNRTEINYLYYTQPLPYNREHHQLLLYLPARTAIILKKEAIRSVH